MFRRKEEDESDIENQNQGTLLGSGFVESASVIAPERASSPAASQATTAAPSVASSYQMNAAARPSAASHEPARPQASAAAYRPSAGPETPRARTPEPKSATPAAPQPPLAAQPGPSAPERERSKDTRRVLTVGADILLKGEIATCDRLVIEGKVDATLNDVGTVELAESGSFKGIATVENAEISGLFEGELTVKGRLVIYATGRLRGKITYGEIEIARGGELTGEIKTVASANAPSYSSRRTAGEKAREEKVAA